MNVDYTLQLNENYYSVVFPLKHDSKMWFFLDPLELNVWLAFILCVPIYLLAMVLADYIFDGYADWGELSDFVIRNALSEHNSTMPRNKQMYQKFFIAPC